jgi:thymidylate synthase
MIVNNARSVSEALSHGLHNIRVNGIKQESRVGDVLVVPMPVMTVYHNPLNRVLFSPTRDANPFFHVMESLWMLAGRNDLPWLTRFNQRFASYSDDGGKTQPGAYGFRWREYFGYDQLETIVIELRHNPTSRRCVLAMWDSAQEGDTFQALGGSADVPCNTHAYFDLIDGRLNLTVCCRSNDIIWGAHGANAVHFSFLLEYMAAKIDVPMGVFRQFSNNYHLYTNVVAAEQLMPLAREVTATDLYLTGQVHPELVEDIGTRVPLFSHNSPTTWEEDLLAFMEQDKDYVYGHQFFGVVAEPMLRSWNFHKEKNYEEALYQAECIRAKDWQTACVEWITRRKLKHEINKAPFTEVTKDASHGNS